MLTHKNVLATIAALQTFVKEVGLQLGEDDSTLSYLTLAHILGRALEEFALSVGASIGYWQVRVLTDSKPLRIDRGQAQHFIDQSAGCLLPDSNLQKLSSDMAHRFVIPKVLPFRLCMHMQLLVYN